MTLTIALIPQVLDMIPKLGILTVPSMHLLSLEAPTQPKRVRRKTTQATARRSAAPVRYTGTSSTWITSRKWAKEGLSTSTQIDSPIVTRLRI